ncbi:MAG: acyltransferase [Bryobacteraceae bacterium]
MSQVRAVRSPRVPEVDGLRGIAILLVLCHHFVWVPRPASLPDYVANSVSTLSWIGTDILLVLAGFLITRTLLEVKDSPAPVSRFYLRSAMRLIPAYAAFLLLYFHVVLPLVGDRFGFESRAAGEELWFWIPLSNWRSISGLLPFATSHLWAVALLLQLATLWPLVMRLAGESRLGKVCLGCICGALFLRVVYAGALSPETIRRLTPMRLDTMAFGAIAALCLRRGDWFDHAQRWVGVVAIAGMVAGGALLLTAGDPGPSSVSMATLGLTVLPLLVACAIFYAISQCAAQDVSASLLGSDWLGRLGRNSYAIYLVHYPLSIYAAAFWSDLIRSFGTRITWGVALMSFILGALVSYALALVVWNAIERPFYRMKAHVPYWPLPEEERVETVEIETVSTSTW